MSSKAVFRMKDKLSEICPIVYLLLYSNLLNRVGFVPDIKDLLNLNLHWWEALSFVVLLLIVGASVELTRAGLALFDKNNNEEK